MVLHFLDWSAPFLPAVVSTLVDHGRAAAASDPLGGRTVDLGRAIVVLPGRRAGRLVLDGLVRRATKDGLTLVPPRLITPGDLVDAVIASDSPRASTLERRLAWRHALERASDGLRSAFLGQAGEGPAIATVALASRLEAIDAELVAHGRRMADVARTCDDLGRPDEAERWRALEAVEAAVFAMLRGAGLVDPARDRRDRLAGLAFPPGHALLLAGVVELTVQQCAVVDAARAAGRLTVLVHAPDSASSRFDEYGRPRTESWNRGPLGIADGDLVPADDPRDQADAVIDAIASLPPGHPRDDVAIVIADERLARPLAAAAAMRSLPLHLAAGRTVAETRPARLLELVADWLETRSFASLAALVRHPDAEAVLRRRDESGALPDAPAAALDAYWSETFDESLALVRAGRRKGAETSAILDAVDGWLSTLSLAADTAAPMSSLGEAVIALLRETYGALPSEPEVAAPRETVEACRVLARGADAMARVAPALGALAGGADALRLVLALAGESRVAPPARSDAVETIGWLEAPFEPASALVALGVHEGIVPAGATADPFLPDALRTAIGLPGDADRAARDAYRLEALRRARPWLRVVVGRRDESGDSLTPSRLLLRCGDETLPSRVLLLAGGGDGDEPKARRATRIAWSGEAAPIASGFRVPGLPGDLPAPTAMRVTHFASYLHCPYRFALEHLLRLRAVDDSAAELDPAGFGDLVHEAIESIGAPEVRRVDDADALHEILDEALRSLARTRYGRRPPPTVRLQVEQASERLRGVAIAEAAERGRGWRIAAVELDVEVELEIPGEAPMRVRGRIDRIDTHPEAGVRVLDYKTGRSAGDPIEAHHGSAKARGRGEWKDLQLPLYAHLLPLAPEFRAAVGGEIDRDEIAVGYFAVADRAADAGVRLADWSGPELDEAIEIARDVVRRIRARDFPMSDDVDSPFDAFARICQVRVRTGDDGDGDGEDDA